MSRSAKEQEEFNTAIAGMVDMIDLLAEMAAGTRKSLEDKGFSSTAAEVMAFHVHQHMVDLMFDTMKEQKR